MLQDEEEEVHPCSPFGLHGVNRDSFLSIMFLTRGHRWPVNKAIWPVRWRYYALLKPRAPEYHGVCYDVLYAFPSLPHPALLTDKTLYMQTSKKQAQRSVPKLLNLTKCNIRNVDKVQ